MGIFGAIESSASGLMAQRLRLDLVANNIANINTTRSSVDSDGNSIPYRRQVAVMEPRGKQGGFADVINRTLADQVGNGVQISSVEQDKTPFSLEYDPNSPDAAKVAKPGVPVGYVQHPNVNIINEMVDMISASRAYEANVTVINASKSLAMKALEIGRG